MSIISHSIISVYFLVCAGYTVSMVFSFTRRQKILFGVLCLLLLCLVFAPQFAFADIVDGMLRVVSALVGAVVKGLEWILTLFQFLFLWIIEFTILDFAKNWQDGGYLSDFRVVWQVLRDFVNLIIVVFFVITAVMTTFGEGCVKFLAVPTHSTPLECSRLMPMFL